MLREILHVRQSSEDYFRRWFEDDYFEMIVWYDNANTPKPHGFQLCYDRHGDEQALTWMEARGFSHARVDSGEGLAHINATPILKMGGNFPASSVISRFTEASQMLTSELRDWVLDKLREYPVAPDHLP